LGYRTTEALREQANKLWSDENYKKEMIRKLEAGKTPESEAQRAFSLAKSNGRYLLTSPDGIEFCTYGLIHLAPELDPSGLIRVARNITNQHKGWKCRSLEDDYVVKERRYAMDRVKYEVWNDELKIFFCCYGIGEAARLTGCNEKSLHSLSSPNSERFGKTHRGWRVKQVELDVLPDFKYLPFATHYQLTSPEGIEICIYGMDHVKDQFNLNSNDLYPLVNPRNRRFGKKLHGWSCVKLDITPEEQIEVDRLVKEREANNIVSIKQGNIKKSFNLSKKYLVTDPDGIQMCCIGLVHLKEQYNIDPSGMMKVANGKLKAVKGWKCSHLEMFTRQ